MEVNLKRLAQELNLSISTVSRALKDSYEVSAETKKRVTALAKKLNYQPNPFATSLRAQSSKTIAVIVPDIANNFFSSAIVGIEEIAQQKGYHVLIYLTHESLQKEVEITRLLQSGRVDGILMSVSGETVAHDHLLELKSKQIPVVFFDRVVEALDVPTVTTDDYESSLKATQHLLDKGCKRIAYLQVSNKLSIGKKRLKGYQDALEKNNVAFDKGLVITGTSNSHDNEQAIKKLLTSPNAPCGVFASVESLAVSTYEVCRNEGIAIPDQLKVISFSNLATAGLLAPSLTTVTQPAFEIGMEAAKILFRLLKKNTFPPEMETVIASELVERMSTS